MTKAKKAPRGGFRENAGRKSAFPDKVLDKPFAMDFTPRGHRALHALTVRRRLSRNDVIAHLAKQHANTVEFRQRLQGFDSVVFPGKSAKDVLSIRVDREAGAALRVAKAGTGKSYSDIGEALVRWFGRSEKSYPKVPASAALVRRRRSRKSPLGHAFVPPPPGSDNADFCYHPTVDAFCGLSAAEHSRRRSKAASR